MPCANFIERKVVLKVECIKGTCFIIHVLETMSFTSSLKLRMYGHLDSDSSLRGFKRVSILLLVTIILFMITHTY